jgi:phage repressor protein C with HTH and peptisase S24 domain
MDPVRDLVLRRLDEIGETLKSASVKLGRNHAYLQQFIHRGVPARLTEDTRHALARLIGVAEGQLRGAHGSAQAGPQSGASGFADAALPERNAALAGPVRFTGKIPLYGQAEGGADGQFPLNGSLINEIDAPPPLVGVSGAYAVMVVGTSMEPRYFAGEAVFVNPRVPVRAGDFVVAQVAAPAGAHEGGDPGEPPLAYVKRYLGRGDKSVRFEQLNPGKRLTFPADRIVSIHRVVMSGEG